MSDKFKAVLYGFLLAISLQALSTFAGTESDLQFTASGVIDNQYYSNGEMTHHLTNFFSCYVSGGRYSMFFTVSNPREHRTRSLECLFDGTNTYFTKRFSTNPVTSVVTIQNDLYSKQDLAKPLTLANNAILEISSGSVPSSENEAVTLAWLSLGSMADKSAVLAESQSPLTYMGKVYNDKHIKLKAASRLHAAAPGFLEWSETYHEGNVLSEGGGQLQRTPLGGNLINGYTNSTFAVTAWTNILGQAFPQEARLSIFIPPQTPNGTEFQIVCLESVTSINTEKVETSFSPRVDPKTTVAEKRFGDDTRYYLSEDGTVLNRSELDNNIHFKVSSNQSAVLHAY